MIIDQVTRHPSGAGMTIGALGLVLEAEPGGLWMKWSALAGLPSVVESAWSLQAADWTPEAELGAMGGGELSWSPPVGTNRFYRLRRER